MLGAHDEDSAGPQQPYPAAVKPGQPPRTVPPVMPQDEDILVLQDSAVGRGAFCVPVPATATACTGSPVEGFSLADLHLGPPIARQTYHATCAACCIPYVCMRFAHPEKSTLVLALYSLRSGVEAFILHPCTQLFLASENLLMTLHMHLAQVIFP